MNPITCVQAEALFIDYLDGKAGERVDFEAHLASCTSCKELIEDMRLAMRSVDSLADLEPPPALVARILEQTTGHAPAGVPEWRHRLTGWWDWTRSSIIRPVLEPRFAIGMAMTIISFSMLAGLAGFDVRRIKLSDLSPVNIVRSVDRGVHLAGASASKAFNDLRVVYEIQTQIQVLREQRSEAQPEKPAAPAPKPEDKPNGNKQDDKKPLSSVPPAGKASRTGERFRWSEEAAD